MDNYIAMKCSFTGNPFELKTFYAQIVVIDSKLEYLLLNVDNISCSSRVFIILKEQKMTIKFNEEFRAYLMKKYKYSSKGKLYLL